MKGKYFAIGAMIVLAVGAVTLGLYSQIPARIPLHWNFHNQVDRYGDKWPAVVLIPAIMAGIMALMAALPWLSPQQFEVDSDRPAYLQIMLVFLGFFAYVQLLILSAALGRSVDMTQGILGAMGALFAGIGVVLPGVPRNFYVGVRTPWTIASQKVWVATHQFAGRTFFYGGLATMVLTFLRAPLWIPLVLLFGAGLAPVAHSLMYYKQLEGRSEARSNLSVGSK